jgi:DNA-directed RNA polymerase specialized sigma24 family protein
VAAEAFTALWETLETGTVQHPKGLLYRIAEGLARNAYRASKRDVLIDAAKMHEPGKLESLAGMRPAGGYELTFPSDFDGAVRGLTEPDRDVFILTELRGLTVREAAGVLDTSYPTIHRRAEAARRTVRKELA